MVDRDGRTLMGREDKSPMLDREGRPMLDRDGRPMLEREPRYQMDIEPRLQVDRQSRILETRQIGGQFERPAAPVFRPEASVVEYGHKEPLDYQRRSVNDDSIPGRRGYRGEMQHETRRLNEYERAIDPRRIDDMRRPAVPQARQPMFPPNIPPSAGPPPDHSRGHGYGQMPIDPRDRVPVDPMRLHHGAPSHLQPGLDMGRQPTQRYGTSRPNVMGAPLQPPQDRRPW